MTSPEVFTTMKCKVTGKDEKQFTVKQSEDGIHLKCEGCGQTRGYEIGFFSDKFKEGKEP